MVYEADEHCHCLEVFQACFLVCKVLACRLVGFREAHPHVVHAPCQLTVGMPLMQEVVGLCECSYHGYPPHRCILAQDVRIQRTHPPVVCSGVRQQRCRMQQVSIQLPCSLVAICPCAVSFPYYLSFFLHIRCKGTNKREKYQMLLSISKREYLRAKLNSLPPPWRWTCQKSRPMRGKRMDLQ